MKNHNSDSESDDGVAQRLNFNTPEKGRVNEWRISTAEDYTRKLFDSNNKSGESRKNIILVMPFLEEPVEPIKGDTLLHSIHSILNE